MTQKQISMLINLFSANHGIVWIVDENWKLIGKNQIQPPEGMLYEFLELPVDFWDNIEKIVYLCKHFWECRIYSSRLDKYRVIVLHAFKEKEPSKEEVTLANTAQLLIQTKYSLQMYLEKHQLSDYALTGHIERSYFLLCRQQYLKKLLYSVYSEETVKNTFVVSDILRQLKNNIQKELGNYAQVSLSLCKEKFYLHENLKFFHTVILAGLLLCHQKIGCLQKIKISLTISGQKGEILLKVTPDETQPIDMSKQIDALSFGDFSEEKQLLNAFCAIHNGNWKFLEKSVKKAETFCCKIQFCSNAVSPSIDLHSPSKSSSMYQTENHYRMLLSRMYLSCF